VERKSGGRIEKEAPRDWWTPPERREGTRGAEANAERKRGAGFLKKMVPRIFLPGTMSHAKKDPVHEDILARIELRFKKQGLNSTRLKYRPATRAEATN